MTKFQSEIDTLMARNVVLRPEVREQIRRANEATQRDLLPTLRAMDAEQTKTFRRAVDRNPNLFEDWGNAIEKGRQQ